MCDGMGNSCAIDMQLTFEVSTSLIYGDAIQVGGKQAKGLMLASVCCCNRLEFWHSKLRLVPGAGQGESDSDCAVCCSCACLHA